MKKANQLGAALLVITMAWWSADMALRANRLQKRLATLEASQRQLLQKHRLLKEDYLQWLQSTGTAPVSPIICQMKTFVFDADGVICVGESFSVALERKHEIPRERLASFFTEAFPGCVLGRRDLKEAIAPYAAEWGWRKSVEA